VHHFSFRRRTYCGETLVFRAHLHNFLTDSFYYAILRAIHICATIGRHCQFFSAHFLRSKCYPYLQEHITFESHNIFQATYTNELFVTMEGTVIFASVTNCALTLMSLLSFLASAQQRNELTFNSNSHNFIPNFCHAPCTSAEGETGTLKT